MAALAFHTESLHAAFNYTERAYNNMRDRVEQLKVVLQNHHLRILPATEALQPPLIKQRRKKIQAEQWLDSTCSIVDNTIHAQINIKISYIFKPSFRWKKIVHTKGATPTKYWDFTVPFVSLWQPRKLFVGSYVPEHTIAYS